MIAPPLVRSVITVESIPLPSKERAFPLMVIGVNHVADPAGTITVSPLVEASIANCTAEDSVEVATFVLASALLSKTCTETTMRHRQHRFRILLDLLDL